jgi:hypothetical protein
MNTKNETNGSGRPDILTRREADVKAAMDALRAAKKKQRDLDRETAAKIHALLGAAIAADLEGATDEERAAYRAYITGVLGRTYEKKTSARALLEANGWL